MAKPAIRRRVFGYKVLAVSYGGSLKLFGKHGTTSATLQPKDSGSSWVRLARTIFPCDSSNHDPNCQILKVSSPVDWWPGDHIVVTTTDYLPNHSEELLICGVGADHETIEFTSDLSERICHLGAGFNGRIMGSNIPSASSPSA
jgi:hypothetical protein